MPPPVGSCLVGQDHLLAFRLSTKPALVLPASHAASHTQAGAATPSVEDILHLEKRWAKLPGASAGGVSLEDATALLGAEVLAVSGVGWAGGLRGVHAKLAGCALVHRCTGVLD